MKKVKIAVGDWPRHRARIYYKLVVKWDDKLRWWGAFCDDYAKIPPATHKHADYIIRGNADYRNDASVTRIWMLVIDGDGGLNDDEPGHAPPLEDVAAVMDKTGLSYLLSRSWTGYQPGKCKWRLFVPLRGKGLKIKNLNKAGAMLRYNTALLYDLLHKHDIDVKPVRESYVLSQAWYTSTKKQPVIGQDIFWQVTGRGWKIRKVPKGGYDARTKSGKGISCNIAHRMAVGMDWDEAIDTLHAGGAGLHIAILHIIRSLRADGYPYDHCQLVIEAHLNKKPRRKEGRFLDLETEMRDIFDWTPVGRNEARKTVTV